MSGGAAGIGVLARVSSLISVKTLTGIFLGVVIVMGAALLKVGHDRDVAQGYNRDIGAAVAKVTGADPSKLKPSQLAAEIKVIGTDRDTARRERDNFKSAASLQTKRSRELASETARLKAVSDKEVERTKIVTKERDRWIAQAQSASARTERLPDNTELKQTEATLDQIYRAGF